MSCIYSYAFAFIFAMHTALVTICIVIAYKLIYIFSIELAISILMYTASYVQYVPGFVGLYSRNTNPPTIHSCLQMERLNEHIEAQGYVLHQQNVVT